MKYGYFDDEKREYVINTPKTPYPWINYLGTEDFFSLVSNTSGGYCFYKDARLRRITRYRYNNIPIDNDGRHFYINDGTDIWSPGWIPVKKDLDFYECRHGLGYTSITGEKNGIRAEQLMFVPLHFNGEVHRLRVKNTTNSQKQFTLFSYIEFCLWNAYDDMTNFQRNLSIGEVEVSGSVIFHKTEYRERRNHYSFYAVNTPIDGFDTDREAFLGQYGGLDAPQAVVAGKSGNSIASGWSPIASHCIHLDMQAGEEKTYIFVLGYVEYEEADKWEKPGVINKSKARLAIARFSSEKDAEDGILALKSYWNGLLSRYMLESEDDRLNRMVNIWNPYQCMVTFNMSRSASYFESGIGRGMGFRDSNQDILGFVHQMPERARERILDIAAIQFEDGNAYHQYQPLTKKGNSDIGGGFNDDPLWLILSTSAYIKETGDFTILDVQIAFDCDETKKTSLFEHLKRSFYYVVQNLGPHGLPLIGRADWNDCLNLNCFSKTPDESFQTYGDSDGRIAESVFIAGLFVFTGNDFVELCKRKGFGGEAVEAQKQIDVMVQNVLTFCNDGEWFIRAYDAFGEKVGSRECEEGQIFIEPQGLCVMAGIGVKEGLARKALDSVWDRLNTRYGIILQNTPYESYHLNLGEISSYPPGYKENAGVFCHNNPWIAIAETVIGRGNKAFEAYSQITPSYIEDISEIHKMEPYIYSQMIAGKDAIRHGEAKNSWLTGTAAWSFAAVSQWILGIKPEYDGLKVDPCIPSEWNVFTVIRQFRGARYYITVHNPNHISKGVKNITINGVELSENINGNASGNILPVFGDGKEYDVQVEMG